MTWRARFLFGVALASFCASQALGQESGRLETKQPFEIVRSIQAIQDQIVRGNESARGKLPKLIEQMAERLLASGRDVWRQPKNARAAVLYTLSGGQARVIRKAIETGLPPQPELELMRGALAYVEEREAEAKKVFSTIDPKTVAPAIAGHVAMIKAALAAKENPQEAIRLLDLARILSPGTLVEETALRRELVLADEIADIDKFAFLSSEYIWRFPHSAYFESFRQRFVASALHFGLTINPSQFAALEELVGQIDSVGQLALYLQIARKSIIDGKPGAALFAARKAGALAADASAARARATLYESAALILTDQYEKGLREFESVDPSWLPKQDVQLKELVASLAKQIGDGPGNQRGPRQLDSNEPAVASNIQSPTVASASKLIDLAQQQLGEADDVLEGKSP